VLQRLAVQELHRDKVPEVMFSVATTAGLRRVWRQIGVFRVSLVGSDSKQFLRKI
jgi:hypothetical protein